MSNHDAEIAELKARIERAKDSRAPLEEEREKRVELERMRRQAEREEFLTRDAPHIAKAEDEHGPIGVKIAVLETDRGAIVVKRPNHLHFKRFQNTAGNVKTEDLWALVKPCIVYPTAREVEAILEELPGGLIPLADLVAELASHRRKEVEKK